MQEDLDYTTRNRDELEREIQGLRTTIRKNSTIMETQRIDLGTYKTGLGRLETKYNDVVAELDEANNEIVERESRALRKPEQPSSISERKSIASTAS